MEYSRGSKRRGRKERKRCVCVGGEQKGGREREK